MTLSALLVFALALIVGVGTPGPGIGALVARVLTNGFRDVLPLLATMWPLTTRRAVKIANRASATVMAGVAAAIATR
jgi:threonine/homoserine/homoserine lactone efflux protein